MEILRVSLRVRFKATGGGGHKDIQVGGYKVSLLRDSQAGHYKVKWWFCVRPYNHPL